MGRSDASPWRTPGRGFPEINIAIILAPANWPANAFFGGIFAPIMQSLFHLAYHVTDLEEARKFYRDVLGCAEGRSTDTWVDFNFFGHQLSLHLGEPFPVTNTGRVGIHMVPMPHLGLVLLKPDWLKLAERLKAANTQFVLEPQVRFEGEPGEQWTMFFRDPCGNPIEVKGFMSWEQVYEH